MNKKILIGILAALLLVLVLGFLLKAPQEVIITTDKTEYFLGKDLTITINIENNLTDSICFSPCSFGHLGKKNGEWQSYLYEECKKPDEVERCVESRQIKAFEFDISMIELGLHRIAVPSCINCEIGQKFEENEKFYSNEFIIK